MTATTQAPAYLLLQLRSCDDQPLVVVHLVLARHAALLRLPLPGRVELSMPGLGARRLILMSVTPAPEEQRPRVIVFDETSGPGPAAGRELPADLTSSFEGPPTLMVEAPSYLRVVAAVILASGQERCSPN